MSDTRASSLGGNVPYAAEVAITTMTEKTTTIREKLRTLESISTQINGRLFGQQPQETCDELAKEGTPDIQHNLNKIENLVDSIDRWLEGILKEL